jgi:hypothetical protein
MNFTKEELTWMEEDHRKNFRLGNILEELNQRANAYLGFQGRTVAQAQEQALIDFRNYIKPGEYVPTTEETDHKNRIYFKAAQ